MIFDLKDPELLQKVNSLTKYPSIPTYHTLLNGKIAKEPVETPFPAGAQVTVTEKVDGTNVRWIGLPDGQWLIGSRDEILYGRDIDELLPIPQGIRETLLGCPMRGSSSDEIQFSFFENYGSHIGGSYKSYTSQENSYGVRRLDNAIVKDYERVLKFDRNKIALWRDHGGQTFVPFGHPDWHSPSTIATIPSEELPVGIQETYDFIRRYLPESTVSTDPTGNKRPEGLVIRTADRKFIAKMRLPEYEMALGIRAPKVEKDPKAVKKVECPSCKSSLSDQVLDVNGAPCTSKFHPINR